MIKTFILIVAFYAGAMSKGDSVSLTAYEFNSQESCDAAGEKVKNKFGTLYKAVNYICAEK